MFNQAGGVGKSTLTMNLGYHLTQAGHQVLLVDMDPQASLTLFMGLQPWSLEETIYESILADQPLAIHSLHGMDLVPANINLSGAELELVMADMRDIRLKTALKPIEKDYNFILIDCPPSLGLLSYISLVASDKVLVPIQTEYKAFSGTDLLLKTLTRIKNRANPDIEVACFVPTQYDSRKSQHQRAYKAIQEQLGEVSKVMDPIPDATAFADSTEDHLPLALFNQKHPALISIQKIADYLEKLDGSSK